jgi:hypothetical protein
MQATCAHIENTIIHQHQHLLSVIPHKNQSHLKTTYRHLPNILDISSYNTMLAHLQHPSTNHERAMHDHHIFLDGHHISELAVDILSRMLAPASYLQCTSSIPCWAPSTSETCYADRKPTLIVDDEYVLLDKEDGGPLCREATIASWKATPAKRERRRGIEWLASVIRRNSH